LSVSKVATYNLSFFKQLFENAKTGKDFFFYEFTENEGTLKEPYRIEPYSIYLLQEGELEVEINLHTYKITAPSIIALAPTVIRKCVNKGYTYKCQCIFFNRDYFLENQTDVTYLDKYDFFYLKEKYVLPLTLGQYEKFNAYFQLIKQTIEENTIYTPKILRSFIYIVLNEAAANNGSREGQDKKAFRYNEKILFEFKNLLSECYKRYRNVSYYAQQLHLSPKHFSTIIKEESGKTAGEWIDEMVLLEAKVLLRNQQLNIAQVADALNFSDQSTFGKFFKNLTGTSPLDYRQCNF